VRNFRQGEVVLRWDVTHLIEHEELASMPERGRLYTHPFDENRLIVVQPPERYVNHSCDNNTVVRDFCDVAVRDIDAGEEITSDYTSDGAGPGLPAPAALRDVVRTPTCSSASRQSGQYARPDGRIGAGAFQRTYLKFSRTCRPIRATTFCIGTRDVPKAIGGNYSPTGIWPMARRPSSRRWASNPSPPKGIEAQKVNGVRFPVIQELARIGFAHLFIRL